MSHIRNAVACEYHPFIGAKDGAYYDPENTDSSYSSNMSGPPSLGAGLLDPLRLHASVEGQTGAANAPIANYVPLVEQGVFTNGVCRHAALNLAGRGHAEMSHRADICTGTSTFARETLATMRRGRGVGTSTRGEGFIVARLDWLQ